jgi:hypothetical protein
MAIIIFTVSNLRKAFKIASNFRPATAAKEQPLHYVFLSALLRLTACYGQVNLDFLNKLLNNQFLNFNLRISLHFN